MSAHNAEHVLHAVVVAAACTFFSFIWGHWLGLIVSDVI